MAEPQPWHAEGRLSQEPLDKAATPDAFITKVSSDILGPSYSEEAGLAVHLAAGSEAEVTLGTGKTQKLDESDAPEAFELEEWDLVVEHWEAPSDLYNVDTTAVKRNTTHQLTTPLLSWTELDPSLHNASGLGFYTSSFAWDADKTDGAQLSLSTALHAVRLYINGEEADPVDPRGPVVDINAFLREGDNEVLAVVPSLMWNYVRTLAPRLEMAGTDAFVSPTFTSDVPLPEPVDNGLVGSVVITSYHKVVINE